MSIEWFSIWNLIRSSGLIAFFLFTLSISAGLLGRVLLMKNSKALLLAFHQMSGWIGFLLAFFHIILLWVDNYLSYSLLELFLPFSADFKPILSGLGTISFFLLFIIMLTSDFYMRKLGQGLWKKVHLFVIPAWVLTVIHGIFIGTDTGQVWAAFLYGGSITLVVCLLVFRYLEGLFITKSLSKKRL